MRFFDAALFWHLSIYLSDTSSGQDPQRGRADFCFQRTAGIFDGGLLLDPAHLRALWWNNSKCLSCIVWHAAGGALKPLLPVPKAPLNKIVKNNSFTLIFPSDYRTRGGKLAAGPYASLVLWRRSIFWNVSKCLLLRSSLHSLLSFCFPLLLSVISLCGWLDELSVTGWGGVFFFFLAFYWIGIRSNMWLMGGSILHSLVLISGEKRPKQLNMAADNWYEAFKVDLLRLWRGEAEPVWDRTHAAVHLPLHVN